MRVLLSLLLGLIALEACRPPPRRQQRRPRETHRLATERPKTQQARR